MGDDSDDMKPTRERRMTTTLLPAPPEPKQKLSIVGEQRRETMVGQIRETMVEQRREMNMVSASSKFKKGIAEQSASKVSLFSQHGEEPEEENPDETFKKLKRELASTPELLTILSSERYSYVKSSSISKAEDYVGLYFEVTKKLQEKRFARKTVEQEIDSLFEMLVKQNAINNKTSERLTKREAEIEAMCARYNKDPRVMSALTLSNKWRQEAQSAELALTELRAELDQLINKNEDLSKTLSQNTDTIHTLRKRGMAMNDDKMALDAAMNKVFKLMDELHLCHMTSREFQAINAKMEKEAKDVRFAKPRNPVTSRRGTPLLDAPKGLNSKTDQLSIMSLNEKFKAYDRKRSSLIDKMSIEQQKVDNLSKSLNNANIYVKTLETKVDGMMQANIALKSHLTLLRMRQEGALRSLGIRTARVAYWEQEFSLAKIENDNLRETVSQQELELRRLRGDKGSLHNKKIQLDGQLMACKNTCEKLKANMSYTGMINSKITKDMQDTGAQNHHLTLLKEMQIRMLKERDVKIKKCHEKLEVHERWFEKLMSELEQCGRTIEKKNLGNEKQDRNMNDLITTLTEVKESWSKEQRIVNRRNMTIKGLEDKIRAMDREIKVRLKDARQYLRTNNIHESDAMKQLEMISGLHDALALVQREVATSGFKLDKLENLMHKMDIVDRKQKSDIVRMEINVNNKHSNIEELLKKLRICSEEVRNFNLKTRQLYEDLHKENMLSTEYQKQRNIFGVRVVQLNAIQALMTVKMEEAQKVIFTGRQDYDLRVKDIFVLKKEITNLRQKNKALTIANEHNSTFKEELLKSNKEVTFNQMKLKRMETMKMTNFHPNRKIEATNPSKYELILKNQKLVRFTIRNQEKIIHKDHEIMQLIKDLYSCKLLIAKSDPDLPAKHFESRADNFKKTKIIKSLTAELNCVKYERDEDKRNMDTMTVENDTLRTKVATRLAEPSSKVGGLPTSSLPPIEPNRKWQRPTHVGGSGFVFTSTHPPGPRQPLPPRDGPIDPRLVQGIDTRQTKDTNENTNIRLNSPLNRAQTDHQIIHMVSVSNNAVDAPNLKACGSTTDIDERIQVKKETHRRSTTARKIITKEQEDRIIQRQNKAKAQVKKSPVYQRRNFRSLSSGERMSQSKTKTQRLQFQTSPRSRGDSKRRV